MQKKIIIGLKIKKIEKTKRGRKKKGKLHRTAKVQSRSRGLSVQFTQSCLTLCDP